MTALRFDVDEVIATRGHYGELKLLRPRTKLGERLREFIAIRCRALGDRADDVLALEREVEGLRAQNEQLTKRLQSVEARQQADAFGHRVACGLSVERDGTGYCTRDNGHSGNCRDDGAV